MERNVENKVCSSDRCGAMSVPHEKLANGLYRCTVCGSLKGHPTPKTIRYCRIAGFVLRRVEKAPSLRSVVSKDAQAMQEAALLGDEKEMARSITAIINTQLRLG